VVNTILGAGAIAGMGWWSYENRRRKRHPISSGYQANIQLPYEEEFELYHNALSLCSMKTRVCLAELGINYRSHHIDLIETGAYENIRRRLLNVNPAGTVPVLLHRGHPIYESHEQIRYAAAQASKERGQLIPEDQELKRQMEYWIERSSLTEDPISQGEQSAGNAVPGLTLPLFASMIKDVPLWKIGEGLLFHFDKRRPLLFIALKLLGLKRFPSLKPLMGLYQRSRQQMAMHLDALENHLNNSGGLWILGEQFTLADVSWLVIFERLVQVDSLAVFLDGEQRPACSNYWQALQARPSYRKAILEHSHPTISRGTQRLKAVKAADPKLRYALDGC